jgi:WD40 repeat protein
VSLFFSRVNDDSVDSLTHPYCFFQRQKSDTQPTMLTVSIRWTQSFFHTNLESKTLPDKKESTNMDEIQQQKSSSTSKQQANSEQRIVRNDEESKTCDLLLPATVGNISNPPNMETIHENERMNYSGPTAHEISTALQSLPGLFFHRIASRIMQVGIDGNQLMDLIYSVQPAESSTAHLNELKETKLEEEVKTSKSCFKREIDQHFDEDRESVMVAGAMVIHANQSKKQKIDTSTELCIPSTTPTQASTNLPTPEEIAAVLQLGPSEYFQQLASQILEMGIDGKQLKKFVYSVVPHVPVNVILRQMLPLLDRVTWNRVCSMYKEIHVASRNVTPPWPYKSLEMGSAVRSLVFSPDGGLLACGCDNGLIRMWDRINGPCTQLEQGPNVYFRSLDFSPDGKMLATAACDDSTIRLWTLADKSLRTLEGHTEDVNSVVFAPNGLCLASGSDDGSIRIWDAIDGSCTKVLHDERMTCVWSVAFSPDGATLASGGNRVIENNEDEDEEPDVIEVTLLWDLLDEHTGSSLLFHSQQESAQESNSAIVSIAYSPDGQYLATGSVNSKLRLWNVATRSLHTVFEGQTGYIRSVCFSPNGKILAFVSNDGVILCGVDAGDCRCLANLSGRHNLAVAVVAVVVFSPCGGTLASGSYDGTVRLWNPFEESNRDNNVDWDRVLCLWNETSR